MTPARKTKDERVTVLTHTTNTGVGGAVMTGYRAAINDTMDIVVKVDGDGQMDPKYLDDLTKPLAEGRADYAKGNRFQNIDELGAMPTHRLVANSFLSFFIKAASGYWGVMDPANGYTAVRLDMLKKLPLHKIAERYFFESDMLMRLNRLDAKVADVPMPAIYGDEVSQVRYLTTAVDFVWRIGYGMVKRLIWQYFIKDFNMASLYLLIGIPMFCLAVLVGAWEWIESITTGIPRSAGTVMLVGVPIILGFQMILQAVAIDVERGNRLIIKE